MIKLNFSLPIDIGDGGVEKYIMHSMKKKKCPDFLILKKSVDARDKARILYNYSVAIFSDGEEISDGKKPLQEVFSGLKYTGARPVVVGAGPAGLFAALSLAYSGAKPIIIERGAQIEERQKAVEKFNKNLELDCDTNVQFGEGGAGAFSDGKLNTNLNNEYIGTVLKEFVISGAPQEILYLNKPHIGTDNLVNCVKNIRKKIEEFGGEFHFKTRLTGIEKGMNGKITAAVTDKGKIETDRIFLCIGHSARDTVKILFESGLMMEQKPFSVGFRIEHRQEDVSRAQYGNNFAKLPPSDYKIVEHINERTMYSFCMCPGGHVINASSEEGGICVNGMSYFSRGNVNANSALLVNVDTADFKDSHPLSGIEFQREIERKAYKISGSYKPPVQRFGDFVEGKISGKLGEVIPSIETGYIFADLNDILPRFVCDTCKTGIKNAGRKISGFDNPDAILTGVETRSSSPVRILRENYRSNIGGMIPVGEGAGYAGGIMSAAIDGIRAVLSCLEGKN